jgi:short-subunit dehydrogenase
MAQSRTKRVVIITGASSGVGEAAARAFAKSGAAVVLAARSTQKIQKLAKSLKGLAVRTDVSRIEDLRALVAKTVKTYGRIDVLVNNAAANARGAFDTLDTAAITTVLDTNLKAPMLLTRFALPHLKKTKGVVINVASIAGHVPLPGEAPYCASKWGLRGFTFAVNEELREAGVALCVVSPGPIATPFVLDDIDHVPDLVFSQPILSAEDVAGAILACATDRQRERAMPNSTLLIAKLIGYAPWLQEILRPVLEAKGAKVKAELKAKTSRPVRAKA